MRAHLNGVLFCVITRQRTEKGKQMNTNKNQKLLKLIYLAMMVALGVVISPILRVEGMCPMQHLINVTCAVMIGPWGALVCAILIGVLRMVLMGITPMALTGAVFGAFLSGMLYRLSHGKLIFAVLGEVIGTGVIGAIVSYPVMTYLWGRTGLTWFFYVPSFTAGTIIGGSLAFLLLRQLQRNKMLPQIQAALGSNIYTGHDAVVNDSLAIALAGFIFYLVTVVIVKNFVAEPTGIVAYLKYIVLLAFFAAAAIFWFAKKEQR
jgi:energy coupling factor transporter S component ThiW